MTFEPLQWIFAALGALMVGVSKSGITGLSILSIALFNHVFASSKQASGIVLPLLIFGDIVAVLSYRRHTQWRYLWKLFPFTAVGVVLGYFTLGWVSDRHARLMIGVIIVALAALSYWRRSRTLRPGRNGSWDAVGCLAGQDSEAACGFPAQASSPPRGGGRPQAQSSYPRLLTDVIRCRPIALGDSTARASLEWRGRTSQG